MTTEPKYVTLNPGQTFQPGDESLSPMSGEWEILTTTGVVPDAIYRLHFRRLAQPTKNRQHYVFLEEGDIIQPGDERYNEPYDGFSEWVPAEPNYIENAVTAYSCMYRRPVKD